MGLLVGTKRALLPGYPAIKYFVDATGGNDANDGMTPDLAWQTIGKVNGETFAPGESVLLQGLFREQLTVPSSGAAGKPITIGVYGSGAIISGADVITGWDAYGPGAGSTWESALGTECNQVFMDDVFLTEGVVDRDNLNDHEWIWVGNVLYVRDDTGDPDGSGVVIEASQRDVCVMSTDKDYIKVQNLAMRYANFAGLRNERGDYFSVLSCDFLDADINDILVRGTTVADEPVVGMVVDGNSFVSHSLNINTLIQVRGTTGAIISNNTITASASGSAIGTQTGGINGAGASSSKTQIYRNVISGADAGILVQYTNDANVCYNRIYDGAGYGIAINRYSDGVYIHSNIIHDLTESVGWNGIDINRGCDDGFVYNNTVYSVAGFCLTLEATVDPCTGWMIKNNILDSSANVDVGGVNASYYIEAGCTFTIDSNLVYISDAIRRGGGVIVVLLATWNATAGVGTDLEGDPLFVNPGADNFHLQAGSPARNDGVDVGLFLDYDNVSIPQETNPAIGAYEYIA